MPPILVEISPVLRQVSIVSRDPTCHDLRSIWDILWSCLATIFPCSWVSVHPNIPEKGEPWWQKLCRRLELMIWSILGPELIITWAMFQWVGARQLAKLKGWTKTHGYFIQMGGFMLHDGDTPIEVLSPERFKALLEDGLIDLPSISEEDIQDRSKGDGLAKSLVIVQTSWFAAQCIARWGEGLVITEIEVVTLAFATLNSVMYYLWWNKPLDVQSTVPVYLKSTLSASPAADTPVLSNHHSGNKQGVSFDRVSLIASSSMETLPSYRSRSAEGVITQGSFTYRLWLLLSGLLFRWPLAGIRTFLGRMDDITGTDKIPRGAKRVNTFYALEITSWPLYNDRMAVIAIIGTVFGAIHCAAWNLPFPSYPELIIWRISSIVITVVPFVTCLVLVCAILAYKYNLRASKEVFEDCKKYILALAPFYVLGRLALLVEAVISLRNLPPGALDAVEWTSFLPHI